MKKFEELNLVKENQLWLNLLCSTTEEEEKFKNEFYDKTNPMDGLLRFRKSLFHQGKRQSLTSEELVKIEQTKDKNKLIEVLSEFFLEPISISQINIYIDSAITADELISLHNKHKNDKYGIRFSALLNGWETIIKQDKREELKALTQAI